MAGALAQISAEVERDGELAACLTGQSVDWQFSRTPFSPRLKV